MRGIEVAKQLIEKGVEDDNIVVYYDPDVDGIVAGFSMERYLRRYYNYVPRVAINNGRGHGVLELECLRSSDVEYDRENPNTEPFPKNATIINVDSGISSSRLKNLVDEGYNVVSLDHHELEYDIEGEDTNEQIKYSNNGHYGLIINNQYSFENPAYHFQSGTGVVLTYIYNVDPSFIDKEMISFNAITLLSDSRDINNDIARNFLEILYSVKEQDAFWLYKVASKIGFNQYTLGEDILDRTYIDYKFSPYINAAMRLELGYETIQFINHLNIKLGDVKATQEQVMKELQARSMFEEFNNILLIRVPSYEQDWYNVSNFIGLLANKYLYKGKNVVIFSTHMNETGSYDFERGSFRGLYSGINYKGLFNEKGILALGHFGAFGIKNIILKPEFWEDLDSCVGVLQEDKPKKSIVKISNMKRDLDRIRNIAYENMFKTAETRVYIKYKGFHIGVTKSTPKMVTYLVDELMVSVFDVNLDMRADTTYIEPVLDKGSLKLYAKTLNL